MSILDDVAALVRNQPKAAICVWSRVSDAPVQLLGGGECFVLLSPKAWRKLNAELLSRGLLPQANDDGRSASFCGAPIVDLDEPEGDEILQVVRNLLRKRMQTGW
jgi:hypothetical protein